MENFHTKKFVQPTSVLQFWRREFGQFYKNPQHFSAFADFSKFVLVAARYLNNTWRDLPILNKEKNTFFSSNYYFIKDTKVP